MRCWNITTSQPFGDLASFHPSCRSPSGFFSSAHLTTPSLFSSVRPFQESIFGPRGASTERFRKITKNEKRVAQDVLKQPQHAPALFWAWQVCQMWQYNQMSLHEERLRGAQWADMAESNLGHFMIFHTKHIQMVPNAYRRPTWGPICSPILGLQFLDLCM